MPPSPWCETRKSRLDELLEIVPGPDFPTAGFIHGLKGIRDAYTTGRGIIQMRARAIIEEAEKGKRAAIIVNELPYQVNKARLVEQIANLVQAKRLEGIADLRDESDRDGIRMKIELKRDAIPEVVLNNLFKLTQMQTTFGIILLGVSNNQPKIFNIKELLQTLHRAPQGSRGPAHQITISPAPSREPTSSKVSSSHSTTSMRSSSSSVRRRTRRRRRPASWRAFGLSALQAQAILDMRLQRLTGLERDKIIEEYAELKKTIAHLEAILGSEEMVADIVVEELTEIRAKYGDRTPDRDRRRSR